MRSFLAGAMLLATVASTATAQNVTSVVGPDDKLSSDPRFAGQQVILSFDDCANPGAPFGISIVNGACQTASVSGSYAQPWQSASGGGFYTTMGPYPNSQAVTIDFSSWLAGSTVMSLSLYWGSIDSYQMLELIDANGNAIAPAIWGGDVVSPANGDQTLPATNRRVNIDFGPGGSSTFAGLRFTSSQAAFEFDDIAIKAVSGSQSVVPEPSTYALMAAGLAGLFGVARRRKQNG